jgi:hypothetical protein
MSQEAASPTQDGCRGKVPGQPRYNDLRGLSVQKGAPDWRILAVWIQAVIETKDLGAYLMCLPILRSILKETRRAKTKNLRKTYK